MNVLVDEWTVFSVDLGGTVELYRGPSQGAAIQAYIDAKTDADKELAVLIEHHFRAV